MAKVKVTTNFNAKTLGKLLEVDKNILKRVAELVIERIQGLARTGKKMVQDGGEKRLPLVTSEWLDQKEYLYETKVPEPSFGNTRSLNSRITFTGQLLESLEYKIEKDGIRIFFNDSSTRKNYTGKQSITNDQLYSFLLDKDSNYSVLELSKKIQVEINSIIERSLARKLRE